MMEALLRIQHLYTEYLTQVYQLEQNRGMGDGLLGMGKGPADDPCHDRFAELLEAELQAFSAHIPSPEEVRSVLEYIYRIPLEHRKLRTAYWMLLAVHGLTLSLIDQLSSSAAEELWFWYGKEYPRWDRLPVQKRVLSALNRVRKTK